MKSLNFHMCHTIQKCESKTNKNLKINPPTGDKINHETHYFIAELQKEIDVEASVKITKELCNTYSDVLSGIGLQRHMSITG